MDIKELRKNFTGEIFQPDDERYEELSGTVMHKGSPAIILLPMNSRDVSKAIEYVKANKLMLSIRSGGHSGAKISTNDGGAIIDVTNLNRIELIPGVKNAVRIGSGARWGHVAEYLEKYNLAISAGDTRSVGVGGLTLGGGVGWMVRKYGLAIDNLLAAEIVTADGQILRVDSSNHSELFWALKGGGGNFGVVTSFDFLSHPANKMHAGMIVYDIKDIESVLKGWSKYMRTAPEELNSTIVIMPSFAGNPPSIMILVCYTEDDENKFTKIIDPLLKFGTVLQNTIELKEYTDVLEDAHAPQGVKVIVNNGFSSSFNTDLVESLVENYGKEKSPALQIRSISGALNRVSKDVTAFAHRDAEFMFVDAAFVPLTATEKEIKEATAPWKSIEKYMNGAYVNFFTENTIKELEKIYPKETYKKLSEIKKVYDPYNLFSSNYNIKPAE